MEKPGTSLRKKLRSQAHALKPVVMIGKYGLSESVITAIDEELSRHELIKLRFIDYKEAKKEIAEKITAMLSCECVSRIGNILVLYRENPEKIISRGAG